MLTDLYVPGDSLLHRTPPQYLIVALIVFCTVLFVFSTWPVLAAATALVVSAYWIAGLPPRHALAAVRPVLWILAFIFAIHLFTTSVDHAAFVVLRFMVMILAASVITLTTRSSEFVDGIRAMLKHAPAWVPAERISLAVALTIRFIPMVRTTLAEVRMAQKARGLERSVTATLVPLVVRTLRTADQVSEALEARSPDKL
jgi:biotin transport system permease protein